MHEDLISASAHKIELYSINASGLQDIQEELGLQHEATTLVNFRDALNHYVKLYETDDREEAIKQTASIDEHLFRGIKDGIVHIQNSLLFKAEKLFIDKSFSAKPPKERNKLRIIIHKLKNLAYDIRMESDPHCVRDIPDKILCLAAAANEMKLFLDTIGLDLFKKNK